MAEDKQKTNSKAEDQAPEDQQPKDPEEALENLNTEEESDTVSVVDLPEPVPMTAGVGLIKVPAKQIQFNIGRGYHIQQDWYDALKMDEVQTLVSAGYLTPDQTRQLEERQAKSEQRKTLFEWLEKFE